ncbi:MAG: RluA family pseudouridine synthase [Caulobacterales bacterium]|nr:RluA family pseudouridine synthase [Caulobacterales bacterium]MCA0371344.1 RluA family pseudouridine synthase [Pseudomonadota bacterium]
MTPEFEEIEEIEEAGAQFHEIISGENAIGERLDKFLADELPLLSRSRIKQLVEKGLVAIDGKLQTNVSAKVKAAGLKYSIQVPAPPPCDPEPENIPLNILFEDDHVLVIDKPAGLSCHPAPGNWTGTLVNAVLYHCGDDLKKIGATGRPGIVHRLDMDTSGVMVVCKSAFAMTSLGHQFQNRTIDRLYHAFVVGAPKHPLKATGRIEARIARDPANRKRMTVIDNDSTKGRSAATNYETLKIFGRTEGGTPIASLIQCKLDTGRTHQVRVHMKHIGCPLIGDMVYGDNNAGRKLMSRLPEDARITRQALHAKTLAFTHPVTSERISFESEYPVDMKQLANFLAKL